MAVNVDKKFVYSWRFASNLGRTHLVNVNDMLFVAGNVVQENDSVGTAFYYSTDGGVTWTQDPLPVTLNTAWDPKVAITQAFTKWYVFAHVVDDSGVDSVAYCKRSVNDYGVFMWDETWTYLFSDRSRHQRITDVLVCEDADTVIHVVYDALQPTGKYAVKYAMVSAVDATVIYDCVIASTPAYNQHNARLARINSSTVGVVYEQEDVNRVWQVDYTQFDYLTRSWTAIVRVSESTEREDHYHPTIAVYGEKTVHFAYLVTHDAYDTAQVKYRSVTDLVPAPEEDVTGGDDVDNDRYPYVLTDSEGTVYVLYNMTTIALKYSVRRDGEWTGVKTVTDSFWQLLNGYCADDNIYTVVLTPEGYTNFVRIDTAEAEVFGPVTDFRVSNVAFDRVTFSWTPPRNAEQLTIQRLAEDSWSEATVLEPLGADDVSTHVILPRYGRYKFRVWYTLDTGFEGALNLDGEYLVVGDELEVEVAWTPVDGTVKQVMQLTRETWEDVGSIFPVTVSSCTYVFSSPATRFRLSVDGGPAEGFSNEAKPLTAELNADNEAELEWSTFENAVDVVVEQSIDGTHWYAVQPEEAVSPLSTTCTVPRLENVVYRFRTKFTLSDGNTITSNTVSLTNTLREVRHGYASVTLKWVDTDLAEVKRVYYSKDYGGTWTTSTNSVAGQSATVSGLDYDTTYWFILGYPLRLTGLYSNLVEVKTDPKPVVDLEGGDVFFNEVSWTFSIDKPYTALYFCYYDAVTGEVSEFPISDFEPTIEGKDVDQGLGKFSFTTDDLPLGSYLNCFIRVEGGSRAGSGNTVYVETEGMDVDDPDLEATGTHSLRFTCAPLERIDATNVVAWCTILVTDDGARWTAWPYTATVTDTLCTFDLEDLAQGTEYAAELVVGYGNNKGSSIAVVTKTLKGSLFNPVRGARLVGERSCFNEADDSVTVFDRGRLYRVDGNADGDQLLIRTLVRPTVSPHVYSAFARGLDGKTGVLAYSWSKEVHLVLNPRDAASYDVTFYRNDDANECMHVDVAVLPTGMVVVTWEENYGYASRLMAARTTWEALAAVTPDAEGKVELTPVNILNLVDNGNFNRVPRVVAVDNGFAVACLGANDVRVATVVLDVDPTSSSFDQELISVLSCPVEVDSSDTTRTVFPSINFDDPALSLAADNLGGLRLLFNSYLDEEHTSSGVTYATMLEGKFTISVSVPGIKWPVVTAGDSVILVAQDDAGVYTSKLIGDTFSDAKDESLVTDGVPLAVDVTPSGRVLMVTSRAGLFYAVSKNVSALAEEVVGGAKVTNEASLDFGECSVYTYALGEPDDHPRVFLRVNGITREITSRDGTGTQTVTAYSLIELVEATAAEYPEQVPADSLGAIRLSYYADDVRNDLVLDLTEWLAYSWDRATIVNDSATT